MNLRNMTVIFAKYSRVEEYFFHLKYQGGFILFKDFCVKRRINLLQPNEGFKN